MKQGPFNRSLKPFPIYSENDYDRAIALLDDLMPLDRPNKAERDFMDIMIPVVEAYEARNHPLDVVRSS